MRTIAWDVDDVLNDLMASWFRQWKQDNKNCKASYGDLMENPPDRILGMNMQQYLASLDEFRLSVRYQELSPVKEVMEWFRKHGSRYRHIALTAVPHKAAAASAQWVFRNFGTWIRTFHFVPSKRPDSDIPVYDEDKAAFMRWIGRVDLFIDDNQDHVAAAGGAGVRSLLFPRPWNRGAGSVAALLRELENL
ncbi:MAG: hypothetical protein M0Z79_04505 [Nitrospiraceae bacterium]|nr:hypothetical protein [Nitrospiraceae bacterium]